MLTSFFNIFSRRPSLADFSFLRVDLHSHLLPGIDDGAKDVQQTLAMVNALSDRGFSTLWTTPHVMVDFYGNDAERIGATLRDTRVTLSGHGVGVDFNASGEYFLDEGFGRILEAGEILPLPGNRVLVEWSMVAAPVGLERQIKRLVAAGYKPVIAHPERYGYWQRQPGRWRELRLLGCELQLNLLSLVGGYGDGATKCAMALLDSKAFAFAATDSHSLGDIERLDKVLANRSLARAIQSTQFLNSALA